MKHNIPVPNPAISALLKSPEMQSLMRGRAEAAKVIYQGIVAKRTGRLARSARVETFLGGRRGDRWIGRLTIGGDEAGYGAAHEFGTDDGDEHITSGAHDLNVVLNQLGGL